MWLFIFVNEIKQTGKLHHQKNLTPMTKVTQKRFVIDQNMFYSIFLMRHCHFMAWHTLQNALKMTGRSRSQFYRDMRAGLISYRTSQSGRREFETSELIRVYGELKQNETPERHPQGQTEKPYNQQTERILR